MKEKIIGIKELHRNLKNVSLDVGRGVGFLVVKNSKPVFRIVPLKEDRIPKYTMDDITALQSRSGHKNLSKKIDEVIYN